LQIREALAQADTKNTEWQRDVSVSLKKIADVKLAQGDAKAALVAYERGLQICEALAKADTKNTGWQADVVISCVKLSGLPRDLLGHDRALALLKRALEIATVLERRGALTAQQAIWPTDLRRRLARLESNP
jgi:hypothetical protein